MARQIILSGPAKIGADWRMPGWSGEVDDDIADQLAASGVLDAPGAKPEDTGLDPEVRIADADVDAAIAAALGPVIAERDRLVAEVADLRAEIAAPPKIAKGANPRKATTG
jgi:hypothetical protein